MKYNTDQIVEACCSKDPLRVILSHVFLQGAELMATNGRVAARVPVELEEGDVDGYIPVEIFTEQRLNNLVGRIQCGKEELTFRTHLGLTKMERPYPGGFPAIHSVLGPQPIRQRYAMAFKVDYLVAAAAALNAENVVISCEGPQTPITVEGVPAHSIPNNIGHAIVMPYRVEGLLCPAPLPDVAQTAAP